MKRSLRFIIVACIIGCSPAQTRDGANSLPQPTSEEERIVQRQVDAYNRHDLEAFLAEYASDAKLYNFPDTLIGSGRDQLRQGYEEWFRANPKVRAVIHNRVSHGAYVIDHEQLTGVADTVGGGHSIAIYEVRNGRIRAVWFTTH